MRKSPNLAQSPAKCKFYAVSRYLDHLLTARSVDDCVFHLNRCLHEIAWRQYRKRPDRTYPRRSKSSYGKWGRKASDHGGRGELWSLGR